MTLKQLGQVLCSPCTVHSMLHFTRRWMVPMTAYKQTVNSSYSQMNAGTIDDCVDFDWCKKNMVWVMIVRKDCVFMNIHFRDSDGPSSVWLLLWLHERLCDDFLQTTVHFHDTNHNSSVKNCMNDTQIDWIEEDSICHYRVVWTEITPSPSFWLRWNKM